MRFAVSFVILGTMWVLLGGHGVIGHHGLVDWHDGHLVVQYRFPTLLFAFTMGICAWIGGHAFFPSNRLGASVRMLGRFFAYVPWLLWQITKSNVDLVYRTLHPDMPINPRVIRFKTGLDSDLGQTLLANSITLTPGTVTIGIEDDGTYVVHAIAVEPAESLLAGEMQRRCEWVEKGSTPQEAGA